MNIPAGAAREAPLSEQVELLTGCGDHLAFVRSVLDRTPLDGTVRDEIHRAIEDVRRRRDDPKLYLATIGEFSSGKSTLLNALLREELLKVSALPATAAAVELYWSPQLQLEVTFESPRSGVLRTRPGAQQISVSWLPGVKDLAVHQFLHLVTADETVAAGVTAVRIGHPAEFLRHEVVLIDTPGANAANARHAAVTRRILAQQADAALVIIPATAPLSQSLVDFLTGLPAGLLSRCLFAVTRMDQVRPQEQADLLKDIGARLALALGLEAPVIYPVAAQVVLDALAGEEIPEHDPWCERFALLEAQLAARLREGRVRGIVQRVLELLDHCLGQLEMLLKERFEHHEERRRALESVLVHDVGEATRQHQQMSRERIEQACSDADRSARGRTAELCGRTRQLVATAIAEAKDAARLNRLIQAGFEVLLAEEQTTLQQAIQGIFGRLNQEITLVETDFEEQFQRARERLESLGSGVGTPLATEALSLDCAEVFAQARANQDSQSLRNGTLAVSAGVVGAMIGGILLPGIGTVVGGAIGMLASSLWMPSLEKRRQELRKKLDERLDAYYAEAASQAVQAIEAAGACSIERLDRRIEAHFEAYRAGTDALLEQQQLQARQLQQLQMAIESDLGEIRRRRSLCNYRPTLP